MRCLPLGLTLTHGSVNAINDYFDYKSGIDLNVKRTPFRVAAVWYRRKLALKQALGWGGYFADCAGNRHLFFIVSGWQLIPLVVVAGLILVLYTPVILKTTCRNGRPVSVWD